MKNKIKIVTAFILGILITSLTVYAISVSSSNVRFTPSDENWDVSTVESALNDLYENRSTNNFIAYYYYNSTTNISGKLPILSQNERYAIAENSQLKILKDGKITLKYMYCLGDLNLIAAYVRIYHNNNLIHNSDNNSNNNWPTINSQTIDVKKDDIIYFNAYGGVPHYSEFETIVTVFWEEE